MPHLKLHLLKILNLEALSLLRLIILLPLLNLITLALEVEDPTEEVEVARAEVAETLVFSAKFVLKLDIQLLTAGIGSTNSSSLIPIKEVLIPLLLGLLLKCLMVIFLLMCGQDLQLLKSDLLLL